MSNRIGTLLNNVGLGRLSAGEYNAHLNGLNMFFGAVLGFVLTRTEHLSSLHFASVLMGLASVVVSILYISSSRHRVAYSIFTLALALALPEVLNAMLKADAVPDKVRPTLLVWALMTIVVEFWSRERHPATA